MTNNAAIVLLKQSRLQTHLLFQIQRKILLLAIMKAQQHGYQNPSSSQYNANENNSDNFNTRRIIRLFVLICIYRIANAWMIRTQFDPDEYWQTLEPAYCLVFGSANNDTRNNSTVEERNHQNGQENYSCALTWEWSRRWSPSPSSTTQSTASMHKGIIQNARLAIERALHGPVRSYVSILPTYCYYLACRYMFHWAENIEEGNDNSATNKTYAAIQRYSKHLVKQHATYIISKGPAFLNAILVAAPTDLSVWLIASRMDRAHSITATATVQHESCCWKSWQFWALMCSITSWFHGYALVRTYANSVETMCLMVGVALLGPVSSCWARGHV